MSETTRQIIKDIHGEQFRVEIYTRNGGNWPLVDLIRTFIYQDKPITQKISFPLNKAADLAYVSGEIKAERDKLNGQPATPRQDSAAEAAIKGD